MKNLLTAIYSKFTETIAEVHHSIYTDVGGRFYLHEAPQDVSFPYIVYQLVSDSPEYWMKFKHEGADIQFNLFSQSPSASGVMDMYTHLKTLFDDCSLTVTGGYTFIQFERDFSNLIRLDDNIWQYIVQYNCTLEV